MRKTALLLTAAILFSLCGCWDMKEINDQAYIVGLGIDGSGDMLEFTFQKAVPAGINSAADSNSVEYRNVAVKAETLAEAVRTAALSSSTELNFEHLSCVLIGSEPAHSDFRQHIEYLMQRPDVRRQCVIAAASGTARSLLSSDVSGSASASGIASMLRQTDYSNGCTVIETLSSLSAAMLSGSGFCLYAVGSGSQAEISASDTDNALAVTGAFAYSSDGFSGTLSAGEADLMRLFAPNQRDGMIRAEGSSGEAVFYSVERSVCRTDCIIADDKLFYTVDVNAVCRKADEHGGSNDKIDEKALNDALYSSLSALITRSQLELGPAVTGLDDTARKKEHDWYSSHREEFTESYGSAVIKLKVDCRIERTGVLK